MPTTTTPSNNIYLKNKTTADRAAIIQNIQHILILTAAIAIATATATTNKMRKISFK